MKKIIIILVILLFAAGSAMAGTLTVGAGGEVTTGSGDKDPSAVLATLSNNVHAVFVASTNQFSAITKHVNGSKNYATASDSTKIFWTNVADANDGTATFEITLSASDTADFSDWDTL